MLTAVVTHPWHIGLAGTASSTNNSPFNVTVACGSLAVAPPDEVLPDEVFDPVYGGAVDIPQLVLAGDSDPLADRGVLARASRRHRRPAARLCTLYDVFNDL